MTTSTAQLIKHWKSDSAVTINTTRKYKNSNSFQIVHFNLNKNVKKTCQKITRFSNNWAENFKQIIKIPISNSNSVRSWRGCHPLKVSNTLKFLALFYFFRSSKLSFAIFLAVLCYTRIFSASSPLYHMRASNDKCALVPKIDDPFSFLSEKPLKKASGGFVPHLYNVNFLLCTEFQRFQLV